MKPTIILSWFIQLATAAILVMAGLAKLSAAPESVAMFQMLDFDPSGRLVIGVLELAAAVLLLVPQSILWGSVLAWGLMTGALIAHCTRLGFTGEAMTFGIMAALIWLGSMAVIFLRRNQSMSLRRMFAFRGDGSGEEGSAGGDD